MMKNKTPKQVQLNNVELCPNFSELDRLCPVELGLISQIIPFMVIIAKVEDAQHGLKGQCVLGPRRWTILPRLCNDEYLISLALKR